MCRSRRRQATTVTPLASECAVLRFKREGLRVCGQLFLTDHYSCMLLKRGATRHVCLRRLMYNTVRRIPMERMGMCF